MRELLIATRNEGKMPEIRHALEGVPFRIIDINDVPALAGFEPHEHGSTYEENATIKAREYGMKAHMLTLADDSGIEVEALGGKPGIGSARYAEGTDADRNMKLLDVMKDVPDGKRSAQFVSAIAIYDPQIDEVRTVEERVTGSVTREPRGTRPFGYDPIFLYDEAGKTGGEMTFEEKDKWSHRGRALAKAREILVADFT
ncbi:RdgB/HAM1 family non-canonical purine NTP pyrophosphatase [Candidatus Kaiserbacteria bacterium]|nr:RdgB/HAM1 family non-canonical purine NTP pyrophosphatase [Candidatus Kaiserbacteria bacterium]